MSVPQVRFELRHLPLSARLVLAVYLIAVGVGYFSGLVQLHFQRASSGQFLPGLQENIQAFSGHSGASQMERLLTADESKPFNGEGSMKAAFFAKSAGWTRAVRARQKAKHLDAAAAEKELRAERDGERLALLSWIRSGAPRADYEKDEHPLPPELKTQPITAEYLVEQQASEPAGQKQDALGRRRARVQSILNDRCVRCHSADKGGPPAQIPLDNYDDVLAYCQPVFLGGMSLTRLAQTTHVHLLGFSVLFCLTGLIFSLSHYPGWVRATIAPLALFAQVVDIAFWWLGRADPRFAEAIMITGTIVALSLMVQVIGGLWALFGLRGRIVLAILFALGLAGGVLLKSNVIGPYLERERLAPQIREKASGSEPGL
jgi:hypothetical protein